MKKQYEIELSNEAEDDFDNSYEYYANVSEKVADNFYRQVDNSLTNISENPLRYPEVYQSIRKHVMGKFPFVIYYQIGESTVKIIAIFHTARNPQIWKERT